MCVSTRENFEKLITVQRVTCYTFANTFKILRLVGTRLKFHVRQKITVAMKHLATMFVFRSNVVSTRSMVRYEFVVLSKDIFY